MTKQRIYTLSFLAFWFLLFFPDPSPTFDHPAEVGQELAEIHSVGTVVLVIDGDPLSSELI